MKTQSLKTLFALLVAVTVALNVAVGLGVGALLAELQSRSDEEHQVANVLVDALAEVKFQVVQIQQFMTDASLTGEADAVKEADAALAAARKATQRIAATDAGLAAHARRIEDEAVALHNTGQAMIAAYTEGREAGNAIMKGADGFDDRVGKAADDIDKLAADIGARSHASADRVTELIARARWLTGGAALLLAALIAGLSTFIYRRVIGSIGAEPVVGTKLAQHLAQGNLQREIRLRSGDADSLLAQLQAMQKRWRDVVGSLRGQSSIMLAASSELSAASRHLVDNSGRTDEAAQRIAASIEQLSSSIDVVADQSVEAASGAQATGAASAVASTAIERVAAEVNLAADAVRGTAERVSALDQTAAQISTAAELIREVADQTNLIALNAAIEAARAGEQGRGFAVVADEVRKLAERTGAATRDIAERIDSIRRGTSDIRDVMAQSVARVESGVALTADALRDIRGVREHAATSASLVAEIDAALREQRSTAREIAQATEAVANDARANATVATQVSGHSENISAVAAALNADVAYFKVGAVSGADVDLF